MNETSTRLLSLMKQQQPQSNYKDPHTLNSTDAISSLVLSQGNIDLAATRLSILPADLLSLISNDPQSKDILPQYIRTAASLYLFEALGQMRLALTQSIPDLAPYEVVKAFTSMVQLLKDLTTTQDNTQFNIQEMVLKMMPPNAREALLSLQKQQLLPTDEQAAT